jgi:hypothetical protein
MSARPRNHTTPMSIAIRSVVTGSEEKTSMIYAETKFLPAIVAVYKITGTKEPLLFNRTNSI